MKTRLYKRQMMKALLWYTQKLSENHLGHLLTPARVEMIRRNLFDLQKMMLRQETNPVWTVPVDVTVNLERGSFEVIITDESNLLYLDFE